MINKVNWKAVDYEQTNKAIAAQTGATEKAAYKARKRHAPRTMHKYNDHAIRAADRWANVDWTKQNLDIAKETGLSVQSVYKARQRNSLKNL